jgi:predicted enzyme related to lactoylglutathione lyase
MTNIDHYAPGSFCWIELATTDQNAAKRFYSSLFGWAPADMPMGPGEFYTMFRLDGRDAAAAYTMRKEQQERGLPPYWGIYVAVESADKAAERAAAVGGRVLAPPFDVFDVGRMAVVQDPTGATFSVWQPKGPNGKWSRGSRWQSLLGRPQHARSGICSEVLLRLVRMGSRCRRRALRLSPHQERRGLYRRDPSCVAS